jgi:hypothetical protein
MSIISVLLIIYVAIGIHLMMEPLVDSWYWKEYSLFIKIAGGILSVLLWPLIFFMD